MAVARAAAKTSKLPLYAYLGGVGATRLPVPMMNILNGGKHADNSVDFQEFMVMPIGAPTFAEALRYGAETFHVLAGILKKKDIPPPSAMRAALRPICAATRKPAELIVEAIEAAGYRPGKDIAIALDPAASSFFSNGAYDLAKSGGGRKTSDEMIELYRKWAATYPIVSIEDGHDENDWEGFTKMTAALAIVCRSSAMIILSPIHNSCAGDCGASRQFGADQAQSDRHRDRNHPDHQPLPRRRLRFVVSHRSGETEDTFMADFAVAMGGGQIKTGSACRSERIASTTACWKSKWRSQGGSFRFPFAGV